MNDNEIVDTLFIKYTRSFSILFRYYLWTSLLLDQKFSYSVFGIVSLSHTGLLQTPKAAFLKVEKSQVSSFFASYLTLSMTLAQYIK